MSELKIGPWVFTLPQCPKEATAAVLNEDGELVWYTGRHPEDIARIGEYSGGWDGSQRDEYSWFHNSIGTRLYLDNSDWKHSVILKGSLKNFLHEGVVKLEA